MRRREVKNRQRQRDKVTDEKEREKQFYSIFCSEIVSDGCNDLVEDKVTNKQTNENGVVLCNSLNSIIGAAGPSLSFMAYNRDLKKSHQVVGHSVAARAHQQEPEHN